MPTTQNDYRVYAGETIRLHDDTLRLESPRTTAFAPSLMVEGRLEMTFGTMATDDVYDPKLLRGVLVEDYGYPSRVTVAPGGVATVTSTVEGSIAAFLHSGAPPVLNAGLIEVTGVTHALGVATWKGGDYRFENTGTLRVTAGQQALGVNIVNGATFVNSGLIEVQGGAHPVLSAGPGRVYGIIGFNGPELTTGVSLRGGAYQFLNTGTIRATDGGAGGDSVGVNWMTYDFRGGNSWINRGLIEADIALRTQPATTADDPIGTLTNEGVLAGRVEFSARAETLVNTGEIHGAVNLGGGDDVYDGSAGVLRGALSAGEGGDTVTGGAGGESLSGGGGADQLHGRGGDDSLEGGAGRDFVRGEDGNDTLAGGAEFDDLHGNMGDDLVRGGDGDDWVVGGKDQDRLHGEEGWDVVLGNLGDDTAEGGAGGDWVRGGQGDDIVRGQDGDDWLAGDRGSDTLTGGAGADIFHAWGEAGLDRITDFNAAEGDRINLLAGSTYTVSQAGADTVIKIGGGAQVVLTGVQLSSLPDGWIFGA